MPQFKKALLGVCLLFAAHTTYAQIVPPPKEAYCWAASDTNDRLVFIKKDGDDYSDRGPLGVTDVEAIAFNPGTGELFGANGGRLGRIDYNDVIDPDGDDSEFIGLALAGSVTLPDGSSVVINDVDGLQFDLTRTDASTGTFVLWATQRVTGGGFDILFQIDPNTGLIDTTPTPAFQGGATGVAMTGVGALDDVDDIAVDPIDGTLYAINNLGGTDDQFGRVDPSTGVITYISTFNNTDGSGPVTDMEGFSFSVTGELYGTTGSSSSPASNDKSLWLIDKHTGDTTLVSAFSGNDDYEGCACLTDNVISGYVYYDLDNDNSFDPGEGEKGFSNATVHIYIDEDNSGTVNAGDTKLCDNGAFGLPCPVTDANGAYRFPVAQGNYAVTVDVSTVPAGSTLTHPSNNEEADFSTSDFAQEDANNNFGFTLPAGSGDLGLDKTSNGGAGVTQGQTVTYTMTISNNSGNKQTGIELLDRLPATVSYVPGSTVATGPAEDFLLDRFSSASYALQNGSRAWSSDWSEVDEEGGGSGPSAGQIRIVDGKLRLDDEPDGAGDPGASRTADLTGIANPLLSFDFETSAGVDIADSVRVTVSAGGAFTTLEDITGLSGTVRGSKVYDLSSFISANTTIRIQTSSSYNDSNEFFFVDNVEIRDAVTFIDNWENPQYNNQDGSDNWATDWLEDGEADGAAAGDLQVVAFGGRNVLQVQNGKSISREADLSSYSSARLSFYFRADSLDSIDELVSVEASLNGGGNWTELARLRNEASDYLFLSYDLSDFVSANTRIRFRASSATSADDRFYFDEVRVDARALESLTLDNVAGGSNGDLGDGSPPNLIGTDDRFILANGTSMTVSFDAIVANPLAEAVTTITNEALVFSSESLLPTTDDHTDNVIRGSIGDLVWADLDADGVLDGGETGIAGVILELDDGSCTVGVDCATETTAGDGSYSFTNLAPGSYQIHVDDTSLPAGLVLSPSLSDPQGPFVVTGSEDFTTADFGYYQPGTVSGHLYLDDNGNGTQEMGEADLPNVDVVVTDVFGSPQTVSSDANGDWTATVPPGDTDADVDESDPDFPADVSQTEGTDPTTVNAVSGSNVDAGNDGYFLSGTVSGHLYLDSNGNGSQDGGEPDLANIDVVITESGGGMQTVSTDASGDWFATVPPGNTSADVDEGDADFPVGVTQTEGTDPTAVMAVAGADTDAGNDGYYQTGTVFGHLYLDTNGDGNQDVGEPDLANIDVVVTDVFTSPQTVSSDVNGDWTATVPPGNTTANVDETDPDFPAGVAQSEGTDPSMVIAVAGSATDAGNDGYYLGATVFGHLYLDSNGDGNQDAGEPDLAGIDVVITDNDSNVQTVATDADGNWSAAVPPGNTSANVDETDPDFPVSVTQTEGTDPTNVVAVGGSATDAGNDGYYQTGTVFGHLYLDSNGDGDQDAGEPDLAGIDVVVTNVFGSPQTVSSDVNGDWTATVPPGNTTANVDETDPDFPVGVSQIEGTDPTAVVAVAGSATDAGNDGYYQTGTVFGHLYLDSNGDGDQDAGEPDLANIDVVVTDVNGSPQTVSSDVNGDWTATVPPGNTSANVDESDPDFPVSVSQTEGTDPTAVVAVAGSATDAGNDGYYQTGTVFGHLYLDSNGDGDQDAGEPDLANIDVVVTDVNGSPQTVSSDVNGDWTATVPPGNTTANVDETDPDFPVGVSQIEGTDPTAVVAVAGSATDAGNDGYYQTGTVFGHLYLDSNGDGDQDAGEPDLANIDVVVTDVNGSPQTVSSDVNGDWTATVPPGNTSANVDESDPDFPISVAQTEGTDPTAVVAVAGSATDAGNDGYYQTGTVFGHLYLDSNGDGDQDAGEPDLANIDVVVTDVNGSPQTVSSDVNGDWTATVPPGNTSANVDETDPDFPAGLSQTEGTDPTAVVAVAGSATDAGNDGYYQTGTVFGHLYLDSNGDGDQDAGEPDLANIDVVVTDVNGSPQTVSSDVSGDWTATVPPGNTSANVDESDPDFPAGSTQTEGTDPTNVNAVAGVATNAGNDGYVLGGTVFGHLYLDLNGDGDQDAGEPDLAAVDVVITDSESNTQTVASDADGNWSASVPAGETSANVQEGDPQFPKGAVQTEGTDPSTVTVTAGASSDAGNDGYFIPALVSGHLYLDTNGNGSQDAGEPDLVDVDVVVTDSTNDVQTVPTDPNGNWSASVPPGDVTADVSEVDPQFPSGSTQTEGTDPTTVTAVAGTTTDAGIDGYYLPATLGGHLYLDTNGNGTQDAGEPNLVGVDVIVTDSLGSPQTVSSDGNGDWSATVPPGETQADVVESDPQFPTGAIQTEGTDPTVVTTVGGEHTDAGIDGYFVPGTVFGHLYMDSNANGDQDAGEPDLPEVDVSITDSEGAVQVVSTDKFGNWTVTVPPGETTANVEESDPDFPTDADQTEGHDPTTVTAIAGESVDGGIDGYFIPGLVGDQVFIDENRNGVFDPETEEGVGGVDLRLYADDGDGVLDVNVDWYMGRTVTNNAGRYQFTSLDPATYHVVVDPSHPALRGHLLTTACLACTVDLGPSEIKLDVDFGFVAPTPVLGLAKRVISVSQPDDAGISEVVYEMLVNNPGEVDVLQLQITDDLSQTFPEPARFWVQGVMSLDLTVNENYTGEPGNMELLMGTDTLAVGETRSLEMTVSVLPDRDVFLGPFENSAVADGISEAGTVVSDVSQDGLDSDPNGNGPGDDGEPTLVWFDPIYEVPVLDTFGLILMLLAMAGAAILVRRN